MADPGEPFSSIARLMEYAEYIYVHVAERDFELATALLDIHPSRFHARCASNSTTCSPGWMVYPQSDELPVVSPWSRLAGFADGFLL